MTQSNSLKVVTVTLNPALDLTGHLDTLNPGKVSLANTGSLHAAGKGVNVAKVLADLGADVTLTGFLGDDNQGPFTQYIHDMGATDAFIRVKGATRINVKLVERSGQVSDINFPGVVVDADAIQAFEQQLFSLAADHDVFVIAGSLPQGVDEHLCASWITRLKELNKRVIFDSSKAALKAGIEAAPWLIKPNDEELAEFEGKDELTDDEIKTAASNLAAKGIDNVVVSLGANGVIWLKQGQWLHAKPPKMSVVSTVGAGDTLVAGLCWALLHDWEHQEQISFATALSALAVTQVGVGVNSLDDVSHLQHQIHFYQD
ncbi:MAG: 1-phosphofructokinase [Vibrio sp.]